MRSKDIKISTNLVRNSAHPDLPAKKKVSSSTANHNCYKIPDVP